jgi:ABC-type branched-subunit amino acid transport system substrate-binding protein
VKNRILFISLAVVLALGVSLVGCGGPLPPTAPESILVGLARDLDGPLSVFECGYAGTVYRYFADKVNAEGGIELSDYSTASYTAKVPIELKVRDFDVMTWDLGAVTEALIETDKVDFVWGGPGTDCIFTQAPICNAAAKVLITLEGGASSMIWDKNIDNWPYVWVSLSFANWYQIPVLQDMLQAKLGRAPKAYMTYIGGAGSTHGIEYKTETITQFGAANVIDGGFHDYDLFASGTADAIIAAAAAALGDPAHPNYDIFCAWTYPWNVAALTIALMGSTFNPPAIIFGPGANGADYPAGFGPYAGGVSAFVVATEETSTELAQMYAGLAAQVEKDWDNAALPCDPGDKTSGAQQLDYWGMPCYVAALEMWREAVEEAGNLDSAEVRDALAGFSSTNPADTVLGDCWYTVFGNGNGGGILAYECHPGEIGQWQNMVYEIVGGNHPTGTWDYPYTGKWFWLLD